MRLNIIGNGFDLYHGLPSSYYYFGCFLAKQYPEFFSEMSHMYGFACQTRIDRDEVIPYIDNFFWRTFEERLGQLNSFWIEDSLLDDLGLECDDPIDIEIPEVINSELIKEYFCRWINSTVNTKKNFNLIKKQIKSNKLKLDASDYYINFNYTQTLQQIYGISDSLIFHIHGKCEFDDDFCNLVVGYGNTDAINDLNYTISQIEKELYYLSDQAARNRLNEFECERSILVDLKKPVDQLLSSLCKFLLYQNNLDITEIWVWGLSCGKIDIPYIESLNNLYPDAFWKFSYFNDAELNTRRSLVSMLKLSEAKVDYFKLFNPNSENILSNIVLANNIDLFQQRDHHS